MKKPVVWIVNTGGTITSKFDKSLGGFASGAKASDLFAPFPQISEIADLRVLEFCNVNSPLLSPEKIFELRGKLEELLAEKDVSGAVVVHGTATMEESAYLLELTLRNDKPVVFTGAMRQFAQPDTDGPRNLLHAVIVASHQDMVGMGVTVVMAEEIHHARDVVKSSATAMDSMHSYKVGYLGKVDTDGVFLMRRPLRRQRFQIDRIRPRVQLLKFAMGQDDLLIRACIDAYKKEQIDGLILEGAAIGNVNSSNFNALKDAFALDLPTVITSRCVDGTTQALYGYEGSCKSLEEAGAIRAFYLGGTKARILLMVALARTRDREELRRIFAAA